MSELDWYEHGFVRPLHPDATDDQVAELVAAYHAERLRRVELHANPPARLIPGPAPRR
jgi:hypothetical protein